MAGFIEANIETQLPELVVPSLRANFSWTLVGNAVYSACQWGMISALAKMGNTSVVGSFALGLAITAPVFMFTNLQLRGVQATDAHSEFAFSDYFTLRLLGSLTGLSAVVLLALLGRFDRATEIVILLVGLAKAIESLSDVVAGLLQKAERLDRVAISLMIRGSFSLVSFATAFRFFRSLIPAVVALVVVWLAVFLLYDLRQALVLIRGSHRFFALRWPQLKTLAQLSAPLGIVMTMVSLNVNIPRYILVHSLGASDLGIFASLAYLLVAINLVITALGQSVASRLSRMYANGEIERFRKVLGKLLAFAAMILLFGVPAAHIAGRTLLTFIYRPEYGQHVSLFVIMVATAGISSIASFLGYGMTAARILRMQVPVIGAATLATVLSSMVLIPRTGLGGAACALLLGACIQAIGCALVLHRAMYRLPRQSERQNA